MLAKPAIQVHLRHEFMPPEPFLVFQQRTCPIHRFRSKTHVFEGFAPFCQRTRPVAETSIGVHLIECCFFSEQQDSRHTTRKISMHSFRSKTHILGISHHFGALKCPFGFAPHTLRLKLMFQVVSRHFVAAPDPL